MLDDVTRTLVNHIASRTSDLNVGGAPWVVAEALDGDATPTTGKLIVSLVAAEQHAHMRNQPLTRTDVGFVRAPLAMRLLYIVTYFGGSSLEAQRRLARVLQVFHSQPILGPDDLEPAMREGVDAMAVRLHSPGLDERNQLWTALGRPMLLSLYYEVDVAYVPVLQADGIGEIRSATVDYSVLERRRGSRP